jgi:glutamate synthase domain-containing protein 2
MIFRLWFYLISLALVLALLLLSLLWRPIAWLLYIVTGFIVLGAYDIWQKKRNILRNYPVWGHLRYLMLKIRPQIQQYFINTDQSGRPFNKEMIDLVYRRATNTEDNIAFGTQLNVKDLGYEWINHSILPTKPEWPSTKILIGGMACKKPYLASRLNISGMSFGALSPEAIRALNRGAKLGDFAQDTGEGGISKYHLMEGGDLIWEIGTGYFGCRDENGLFDLNQFKEKAKLDQVKMIEIKLSQGAKPGHGAILPKAKITPEIADARGIPMGQDCLSPARHSAFSTPLELMDFIECLRTNSTGKPIGFKLCIGIPNEFMAICKAMLTTGITPDFIVIDGSEGGTGAGPVEFCDSVGTPLNEGLVFAHNCLVASGLRNKIKLIASGKIITGFDIACKMSLGADLCNIGRGMLFAIGCVQSLRCHTNKCPTGITTQDPHRRYALDIDIKAPYVKQYHQASLKSFIDVLGAVGLTSPEELQPIHIHRRINERETLTYADIYDFLSPNALLEGNAPLTYQKAWEISNETSFFYRHPSIY